MHVSDEKNIANVKRYVKTRPTGFCSVEVVRFPFLNVHDFEIKDR